jgi:hypothetical protein
MAMEQPTYTDAIRASTEQRRQDPDWSQWFIALDGTRTPISLTQELTVLRGPEVAAHLETALTIREALGPQTPPGLIWLGRTGEVRIGEALVGHWEA